MPGEERVRGAERCSVHGSIASVATCDGCGRSLCLTCAIPVRGRTLGSECLATVLGNDAPTMEVAIREAGAVARLVARVAFALAVVSTALPWSRFGTGSAPFGAWSRTPQWSMLAAVAAVAGLLLMIRLMVRLMVRHGRGGRLARALDVAPAVAGALVVIGSALAIGRPPAFTSPWLGPWVALAFGVVAAGASILSVRTSRIRARAPI